MTRLTSEASDQCTATEAVQTCTVSPEAYGLPFVLEVRIGGFNAMYGPFVGIRHAEQFEAAHGQAMIDALRARLANTPYPSAPNAPASIHKRLLENNSRLPHPGGSDE
jgi:hypothetical protein